MTRAYNVDCMEAMRKLPDKAFDLAIVDPPYGIGNGGGKNSTRSKLAAAKNYRPFMATTKNRRRQNISMNSFGCRRTKSFGAAIISAMPSAPEESSGINAISQIHFLIVR